jgi:uncharacterized protein YmfQ (DUF2313 family)
MELRSADDYWEMLKALIPPGRALKGPIVGALLKAYAQEFARVHAKAVALLEEADPATTLKLLGEWEAFAGLPGPCVADKNSLLATRRAALRAKLLDFWGQTKEGYIALAASYGVELTIEEIRENTCLSTCVDPLYSATWVNVWRFRFPSTLVHYQTCLDNVMTPLADWGNDELECLIRARQPAHAIFLFAYGD